MTHVEVLIESPMGSAGVEVQLVIAAPLVIREVGEILMAVPATPLVPVAPVKLIEGGPC